MAERTHPTYPVFVMCGRDAKRRRLLEVLDPEGKYKSKALLPFQGKRLIDWPLEALRASRHVEGLYLIGLSETDAAFDYPVHYVPTDTTADFSQKLSDGLDCLGALGKHPDLIVISSSDAPGLRPESVEAFFRRLVELGDHDFVMSVVPEAVVRDLFPESGRVVARFRDHQVFPGELYALSPRAIQIGQGVIRDISGLRRRINRERRKISLGPLIRYIARKPQMWGLILKYLLRQATLEDAERAFSAAFDCKAKAVLIPDPGFGMDMDLPEDYERLKLLVPDV